MRKIVERARQCRSAASERVPDGWSIWLLLTLLAGLLILFSQGRLFWCDELLLISLVETVSMSRLVEALRKAADGGFPLPYFVFSAWSRFAGSGEVMWRVPSIVAGLATAYLIYAGSRIFLETRLAILCATIGTFGSTMFLRHASEVRFYGLYYMSAVVVWVTLLTFSHTRWKWPQSKFIALSGILTAANLCLVMSHQFGIMYSSLLFVAYALSFGKTSLPKTLAVFILFIPGWLLFLGYLPLAIEQKQNLLGQSGFYTTPSLPDLLKVYLQLLPGFSYEGFSGMKNLVAASLILTASLWVMITIPAVRHLQRLAIYWKNAASARYMVWTAVLLLSVPVGFWLLAQVGPSLLMYRYIYPSQLGYVLVLLVFLSYPGGVFKFAAVSRVVGLLVIAWSFVGALVIPGRENAHVLSFPHSESRVPIVSFSLAEFYALNRYSPQVDVYYLLDNELARLNQRTFQQALSEQSIQQARRDLGIGKRIITRDEIGVIMPEFRVSLYNQDTADYFKNVGLPGYETLTGKDGSLILRRKSSLLRW